MRSRLNHYELLDISPDDVPDKLAEAHRKQCLIWHPDKCKYWIPKNDWGICEVIIRRINNAFDELNTDRAMYDQMLKLPLSGDLLKEETKILQKWQELKKRHKEYCEKDQSADQYADYLASKLNDIMLQNELHNNADMLAFKKEIEYFSKLARSNGFDEKMKQENERLKGENAELKAALEIEKKEKAQSRTRSSSVPTTDSAGAYPFYSKPSQGQDSSFYYTHFSGTSTDKTSGRIKVGGLVGIIKEASSTENASNNHFVLISFLMMTRKDLEYFQKEAVSKLPSVKFMMGSMSGYETAKMYSIDSESTPVCLENTFQELQKFFDFTGVKTEKSISQTQGPVFGFGKKN